MSENRYCRATGKISYPSSAQASKAKRALIAKPDFLNDNLNVFHCAHCAGFHLGRSRKEGKRTTRRIPPHEHASVLSKLARYLALTK